MSNPPIRIPAHPNPEALSRIFQEIYQGHEADLELTPELFSQVIEAKVNDPIKRSRLDHRDITILVLRSGLWNGEEMPVREVAEYIGFSPERVRQLYGRCIRIMRSVLGRIARGEPA